MTNKSITLNVWKNNNETAIAIQGEVNSRFLIVHLVDDNGPVDLTGREVKFLAKKPDGTVIFNSMAVDDAKNGTAILSLTAQMSIVEGILEGCEVHIISEDGETLIAKKINIIIRSSIQKEVEESVSEMSAYQELINKVKSLESHSAAEDNPHKVTAEQLGISTTPVQADWDQDNAEAEDYIKNKPSIPSTLSDMDGVLPLAKGGTGATTVAEVWLNLKIYTDISQIGLSYQTTTSKIFQAMPVGSMGLFAFESKYQTITDAPCNKGIYAIFHPVQNRPLLLCQQCISTGEAHAYFFVGYYNTSTKNVVWYRIFNGNMEASIEQGGTGANNAEQALVNLGAAKSADIGDISTLATADKTIVGAINELYALIQNS